MKKRLAVAALAGLTLTAGGSAAQPITSLASSGSWGCVVIDLADKSACLRDPLPDQLPVPSLPTV